MRFWFSLIGLFACTAIGADVTLPSDVSVSLQAEPNSNLQPGQPIRLTITVTNNGPAVLDNFAVDSSNLAADQFDVSYPDTDCQDYQLGILDGATTYWYIVTWFPTDSSRLTPGNSPLAVGESRSCHMTIRLLSTAAQIVPFDFHLSSYWGDPNPSNDGGRVTLQRAPAVVAPIPVVSAATRAGTALLLLLLGSIALARPRALGHGLPTR